MLRASSFSLVTIILFLFGAAIFLDKIQTPTLSTSNPQPKNQLSAANNPVYTATGTPTVAAVLAAPATVATFTKNIKSKIASSKKIVSASSSSDQVQKIENPYSTPPLSFDQINASARNALVNVLCEPQNGSSLNPISGSGVIIDPKGIILTNAHVAQYVLLSESAKVDLKCFIRTGSPAAATWYAAVLYIPPVWVNQHFSEISQTRPTGTGEHDYALLYITGSANGKQESADFPYVPIDTRSAIGFPGDQVLVASYPAELVGGVVAQYNLYADTSVTTIKKLLTFGSTTPDVVSLGGVIEAQEGSSGGAVLNQWGRLIALIATMSDGATTSSRDLHADSLSYIASDFLLQTGTSLSVFLQENPETTSAVFTRNIAQGLLQLYVQQLFSTQ